MKNYCFGIDVGGTTVKMGLFQTDGQLVEKWEIPTRTEEGGKAILPDIAAYAMAKLVEKDISREDVAGIGIGVPGPIDADGVVPHTANLGWGYKEVTKELSELTGVTCKGGNDANVAALGEMWQGGGRGCKNMVMVTLGTGVGCGIIIDGEIVPGSNGAGGEIGHITVNHHETVPCNCGRKGCLEQYASATGIVRIAREHLAKEHESSLLEEIGEISAKAVFDVYKDGDDATATAIVEEFAKILGNALSNLACVLDPEVFVIGGGVSKAGKPLLDAVEKYYRKAAFSSCDSIRFALASLGNDAGMYGCVRLILE